MVTSWVSGLGFAAGFSVTMFSLEHMRQDVNRMLPPNQHLRHDLHKKERSFLEALLKKDSLNFLFEVVDKHREYYPASHLRKKFAVGLVGTVLAFFVLGLSLFL